VETQVPGDPRKGKPFPRGVVSLHWRLAEDWITRTLRDKVASGADVVGDSGPGELGEAGLG
jgi:hypothetical protein